MVKQAGPLTRDLRPGDTIDVAGFDKPWNNGVFEVLSVSGGRMRVSKVGGYTDDEMAAIMRSILSGR